MTDKPARATDGDRYTDQSDRTRSDEQTWIQNRFFYHEDHNDYPFPGSTPSILNWGFELSDVMRAFDEPDQIREAIDKVVKIADHHRRAGQAKEREGLDLSAAEHYQRASLCYLRGSWAILDADDGDKRRRHDRALECFERVVDLNPYYETEVVDIGLPFHDEDMPAYFHKCGREAAPTVIYVPGMDQSKEELDILQNRYVDRGINALAIDGPGQGEARLRGIAHDTQEVYQKAGRAAVDWLVERPEVDSDRIGVCGVSMGTYWSSRIAYEDQRISALGNYMGAWYSKQQIFNRANPFFKHRFMYMADIEDEAKFDEFARQMTLEGLDTEIDTPAFLAHGEYDELTPREQALRYFEALGGPKHLQLYENQNHSVGMASTEARNDMADWFLRVWSGDIGEGYQEALVIPDYPKDSAVASVAFESFSEPPYSQ